MGKAVEESCIKENVSRKKVAQKTLQE